MSAQLDQLLANLDPSEQQRLYDKLAQRFDNNDNHLSSDLERTIWNAAVDVLKEHGSAPRPLTNKQWQKHGGAAALEAHALTFNSFIERSATREATRTMKAALLREVLECLWQFAHNRLRVNYELTPVTLLQLSGYLHEAVEDAYPGYVAARMLHQVILMGQRG